MERTFQVKMPNGQIKEITETLAKQLNRQIQVIGEVIESRFKKRGRKESISSEEFRREHIHTEVLPDGRKVRKVDPGFERVTEIDEDSKPGPAQYDSGGHYRRRMVRVNGREIPYEEWLRTR